MIKTIKLYIYFTHQSMKILDLGEWSFDNCTSLTIYCEATSKPEGWHSNWNSSNRPVVWGYVEE